MGDWRYNFTARPLCCPEKSLRQPLDSRLGGLTDSVWTLSKTENFYQLLGTESPLLSSAQT